MITKILIPISTFVFGIVASWGVLQNTKNSEDKYFQDFIGGITTISDEFVNDPGERANQLKKLKSMAQQGYKVVFFELINEQIEIALREEEERKAAQDEADLKRIQEEQDAAATQRSAEREAQRKQAQEDAESARIAAQARLIDERKCLNANCTSWIIP